MIEFSARRHGSDISLSFSGGRDTFGTISGGSFTLDFPQSDGRLAPVTFEAGSASQYNRAVASLDQSVQQVNQAAIQQEQQAQAAAAAAQAKAKAELEAAIPVCQAVGGSASWQQTVNAGTVLECEDIPYIGTDGATYQASVNINPANSQLEGLLNTAGTGATQQECNSGYYPDLSTGPGYGPSGTWNSTLQACLPS